MRPFLKLAFWAGVVALTATVAAAQVQTQPKWGTAPKGIGGTAPAPAPATITKVEITGSTIPGQAYVNDTVTVSATIKNTGTATVATVPWLIQDSTLNKALASGQETNFSPGSTKQVTATWKADEGTHHIQVYVDPTGTTFKNTAPVSSQIVEKDLKVVPKIVQRYLEWKKATGKVSQDAASPVGCYAYVRDGGTVGSSYQDTTPFKGVVVLTGCSPTVLGGFSFDVDVLNGFTLKNGWKVKSGASVLKVSRNDAGGLGWHMVTSPQAGNDSAYMKLRFDLGSPVTEPASLWVSIQVMIEGPEHKDPYQ
jgi:CARDB protein